MLVFYSFCKQPQIILLELHYITATVLLLWHNRKHICFLSLFLSSAAGSF